jgi:hypothetical protein
MTTNHLTEATNCAGKDMNIVQAYIWHWKLSMKESFFLILMSIGSIIHAFLPCFFKFKLLKLRIERLKELKKQLPHNEQLKNITFNK